MTLPRNVSDALANQTDPPVPIGPVVPGTGATDLGKAEDAPSTSGATGVAMLGVRNDADAVLTDADLDYSFVATDSAGRLKSVSSVPAPVSAAFDFSAVAQTAVLSLANGNTAVAIQVDSMGNGGGLQVDVTADGVSWQQLTVTPVAEGLATLAPAITIIIAANYQAAAAGFAQVRIRCSAFTGPGHLTGTIRAANGEGLNGARPTTICSAAGSPFVNPTNGFNEPAPTNMSVGLTAQLDDVVPTPIAENSWGNLRMSPERSLYSEIRDAAGNERGANVTAAGALQVDGSAVTQPVSGPLTDAQLRAVPVPVSGTVSTGGLTDAQLRATPVTVSGPLTDAQLRATPVPVSGTVAVSGAAVTSVVPGTGATNLGKAEDAPAASGDVGVLGLAVRNDTDSVLTNNDGDYSAHSVDSRGRTIVGAVTPGTGGPNLGKLIGGPTSGGTDIGVAMLGVTLAGTSWMAPGVALEGDTPSPSDPGLITLGYDRESDVYKKFSTDSEGRTRIVAPSYVRVENFVATGNGTTIDCSAPPAVLFSLQVSAVGAVTSWTVVLEASLDGVTFTVLITHTNAVPGTGKLLNTATAGFGTFPIPVLSFRLRCSALVLGLGTGVDATAVGVPN